MSKETTVYIATNALGTVRQVFANKETALATLEQSYRIGQWSEGSNRVP